MAKTYIQNQKHSINYCHLASAPVSEQQPELTVLTETVGQQDIKLGMKHSNRPADDPAALEPRTTDKTKPNHFVPRRLSVMQTDKINGTTVFSCFFFYLFERHVSVDLTREI